MNGKASVDMGLSSSDLTDLTNSFNWVMETAYAAIIKGGKFTWNQFWNYGQ